MKTNKYIAFAAISLCLGTMASCTDGNDWSIDDASNRTMTPKITSVTSDSCALTVAFTNYGGTYFQIEANVNPFPVDDIDGDPMEGSVTSTVTASGSKIDGLNGYTDYYIRMRALNDGKMPSHWILYASKDTTQTATQTTGAQIINPIDENTCTSNSIYVTWLADYTPDSITATYTNGKQKVVKSYALSDANKSSHSLTCDGLLASTVYEVRAFVGEQCMGMRSQKTLKAPPTADYTYTVEGDVIDQTMIDDIAAKAKAAASGETYAACIVIPAGKTVTVSAGTTSVSIPENMTVYFYGNETTGTQATLVFPYALSIPGYHGEISFENLNLTTSGGTSGDNRYIINQSAATSTGNVTFTSCNIYDVNASVVRLQANGGSIGTVTISDCVITNQGSNSYAVIYNQATSGGIGEVNVDKTTFDTCVNGLIVNNSKCDVGFSKVTMSECTIYNCLASGKYIIDAGKNSSSTILSTEVKISKTIIGKLYNTSAKGVQTNGTKSLELVCQTAGTKFSGGSLKSDDGNLKLDWRTLQIDDAGLFQDPDNHDFTLKRWFEQTSADETKGQRFDIYGDPRWRVETAIDDDTEE